MSLTSLHTILPMLIIAFAIVLQLLTIAWRRSQTVIYSLTVVSLVVALVATIQADTTTAVQATILLSVSAFDNFALILVLLCALAACLLSKKLLSRSIEVHDELYVLVLLVVLGANVLLYSNHFASLFLGFELFSIALVGLVGYFRERLLSVEASFKYLILSATASSFMLMGIAFIYSQTGNLSFDASLTTTLANNFYFAGVLLLVTGIGFKLSLVPFNLWVADVYQGAPSSITLILATISKIAMVIVFAKFWFGLTLFQFDVLISLISVLAILSMIIGNLLALQQQNIKRILAYSAIAHMGYVLITLIISSTQGIAFSWQSLLFYLTSYVVANIAIFSILTLFTTQINKQDQLIIADLTGLFWRMPLVSVLLILSVLSLAGIPLTVGFIGKFYLLNFATQQTNWWLITALIVGSSIGLFYYLNMIFVQFSSNSQNLATPVLSPKTKYAVVALILISLLLGVFPDNLSNHLSNLLT